MKLKTLGSLFQDKVKTSVPMRLCSISKGMERVLGSSKKM